NIRKHFAQEMQTVKESKSSVLKLTSHYLSDYCLSYLGFKTEGVKAEEHIVQFIQKATSEFCAKKNSKAFIDVLQIALENGVTPAKLKHILAPYRHGLADQAGLLQVEFRQKMVEFAASNVKSDLLWQLGAVFEPFFSDFTPSAGDEILFLLQGG